MPDPHRASIRASSLQRLSTTVRDELHFTGGLRGVREAAGWSIGPVLVSDQLGSVTAVPDEAIGAFCREHGVQVVGAQEVLESGAVRQRIWHPLLGAPALDQQPADKWGMIASMAKRASDDDYAALALSISVSLRAAGLQLRNASDEYARQLEGALVRKQHPTSPFSNLAVADLHLAFHSLLAELGAARDYLARIAAIHVGAPERIDALNRLVDWATKPSHAGSLADPLVSAMLSASDPVAADPWLNDIGLFRNTFLHREPMGARRDANFLTLVDVPTSRATCRLIRLEIEERPGAIVSTDALALFLRHHNKLSRLADLAAGLAKHPATPTLVVVVDPVADDEAGPLSSA